MCRLLKSYMLSIVYVCPIEFFTWALIGVQLGVRWGICWGVHRGCPMKVSIRVSAWKIPILKNYRFFGRHTAKKLSSRNDM